jgi:hypothetical protein
MIARTEMHILVGTAVAPLLPVIISVSINPRFMVFYRQLPTLAPNVTVGEEPDL